MLVFLPAISGISGVISSPGVCMCHKVVNTSGSIMEQRTASKHGGNVPTALISCQIFIGPMLTLFTGICYLLLYLRNICFIYCSLTALNVKH